MAKVNIVLHGKIADYYKEKITVYAETVREALSAMALIDAFNPAKQSKRFVCSVDGCEIVNKMDEPIETNVLHLRCDQIQESAFITGSGDNPYVNIIIGVILVVVGFWLGGSTTNAGMAMISAGIGLAMGGIMQILNPVDELKSEDNEKNKSITRYQNTVASGTPIPIIVGKHKHGGHIFSLNTASRSQKNVNLSALVSELSEFEGSWVTMHSQLSESNYNNIPSGGYPGGGGGGNWSNLKER